MKKIDIGELLGSFFNYSDWKERSLHLGALFIGFIIISAILMFGAVFMVLIPIIGWLIYLVLLLALVIGSFMFAFFLLGYQLDIADRVKNKKDPASIIVFDQYKERMIKGAYFMVVMIVYLSPALLITFLSIGILMIAMLFSGGEDPFVSGDPVAIMLFLGYYLLALLASIVQTLIAYFVLPLGSGLYVKEKSVSKALDFSRALKLYKLNYKNLLLIGLIIFVVQIIIGSLVFFSMLSVFICIGVILLPLVVAIAYIYLLHFQAEVYGRIARDID